MMWAVNYGPSLEENSMRLKLLSFAGCSALLAACGGGSSSGTPSATTYSLGGTVSGLNSGASVSLSNGADSIKVSGPAGRNNQCITGHLARGDTETPNAEL